MKQPVVTIPPKKKKTPKVNLILSWNWDHAPTPGGSKPPPKGK